MIDESAFLIAIGFAAAALAITTAAIWLAAKTDHYLLLWSAGLAFCVPSVTLLGAYMDPYTPAMNYVAYVILLTGVILIQAGATQFRTGRVALSFSIPAWLAAVIIVGAGFASGLNALGVIALNIACGVLCGCIGLEFWRARREAPAALAGIAGMYAVLGVSFLLCTIPTIQAGVYVLHRRQENWAEDFNSICIVAALAGIGALMLMVAQNRATQLQRRRALSDPLTGLLNRGAAFELAGPHTLPAACAAIMFDLDNFKRVNDRFGHATGDEVLVRFARILHEHVRAEDIAARLGGEEFCVLLREPQTDGARDLAERIRAALAATPPLSAEHGAPTVSAGIAVNHAQPSTFEALLRDADRALYEAKTAGRNRVHGPPPRLVA